MTARQVIIGAGMVIMAIMLAGLWWGAVLAALSGRIFVWRNYWNAPIGTITLIIALTVLTAVYLLELWYLIARWLKRAERRN